MSVLLIAMNSLRRMVRDRAAIFFLFILPLLLILVLGSTVAGYEPRIGIVVGDDASGLTDEVVAELEAGGGAGIATFTDRDEAVELLRREEITSLAVLPDRYGERLLDGEAVSIEYLALPDGSGFEQQGLVQAVVADQSSRLRAALLLAEQDGTGAEEALQAVTSVAGAVPDTAVSTVDSDGAPFSESNQFSVVASQELLLFLFLTGMIAAAALIQSRRLGVTRRMLASPASTSEIVGGLVLGRFGIAIVQGLFIAIVTALLFGVDWGSWPAAIAIIASFSLVATAAAVLVGSALDNENQSTAVGISLGMAFAAFGGCMVPLEVFPDGLRTAAHVTPHAWANDAFAEIIQRGGGLADVTVELTVLLGYAAVLLAGATMLLRRSVTNS